MTLEHRTDQYEKDYRGEDVSYKTNPEVAVHLNGYQLAHLHWLLDQVRLDNVQVLRAPGGPGDDWQSPNTGDWVCEIWSKAADALKVLQAHRVGG